MMWGYGTHGMGYGGGWGMLFGGGLWLIFTVLVVLLAVWALRSAPLGGAQARGVRRPSALDVLEERYARGEINRDEFLEKKRDLAA